MDDWSPGSVGVGPNMSKKKKIHYESDSDLDSLPQENRSVEDLTLDDDDKNEESNNADLPIVSKERVIAKKRSETLTTTTTITKKSKVVVVQDFWEPETRTNHCSEGKEYLYCNALEREIFDLCLTLTAKKGSNFTGTCQCCGYTRNGSASKILTEGCCLQHVPIEKRAGLTTDLAGLSKNREKKYGRNMAAAKDSRQPDEINKEKRQDIGGTWLTNTKNRQEYLLQRTAKFLVACNLPALLSENPFFRDFVTDITGGRISDSDAENVLKRKSVTSEMDAFAQKKFDESEEAWKKKAMIYGGSLLVDGWTAARLVGTIGVTLCCLTVFHVLPLVISGVERSRARDYIIKLEPSVPWPLMFFTCTDGASNMVSFGELLQETKFILPNLCTAHGFSLTVHYIGKVFENRSNMFSKVSGIIAFFNRSTQRLAKLRKEEGSDIGFIKFCKTRMAYQTLALLRVLRLRTSARKAMITIKNEKVNEDDESIDIFSKIAQVDASLNDDRLFKDIELFCRATLPVLIAMREVDRGLPMAGFVYWLHYHVESQVDQIMEKLEQADSSFARLRKEISSAIRFVWDKRHRPVLSFAYITNPLFHADLSAEDDLFELDENFASDIEEVLTCMMQKRYQYMKVTEDGKEVTPELIEQKVTTAQAELSAYLEPDAIDPLKGKVALAADFWRNSAKAVKKFPNIAWCARRVHSMRVVTSRLERFFSHVGNVQTEKRSSLDPKRAALYAAAHQQLFEERSPIENDDCQRRLVELVKRCEDTVLFSFENTPEFDDLESWVSRIKADQVELLYKRDDSIGSATDAAETETTREQNLIDELDSAFESRDMVRWSTRTRRKTTNLDL